MPLTCCGPQIQDGANNLADVPANRVERLARDSDSRQRWLRHIERDISCAGYCGCGCWHRAAPGSARPPPALRSDPEARCLGIRSSYSCRQYPEGPCVMAITTLVRPPTHLSICIWLPRARFAPAAPAQEARVVGACEGGLHNGEEDDRNNQNRRHLVPPAVIAGRAECSCRQRTPFANGRRGDERR